MGEVKTFLFSNRTFQLLNITTPFMRIEFLEIPLCLKISFMVATETE